MSKPKPTQIPVDGDAVEKSTPQPISRRKFVTTAAGTAAAALLGMPQKSEAKPTTPATQYRIHPAIGVARVGNADPSTYFIGPEIPGLGIQGGAPGSPAWPRKVNGQVKPQAARFRVFEYQMDANGLWQPTREMTLSTPNVVKITWNVHLANKKASFHKFGGLAGETTAPLGLRNATVTNRSSLETDFGARFIYGPSTGPIVFQPSGAPTDTYPKKPDGTPVINYLGQLRTDDQGRLLVIGGQGKAGYNTAVAPALGTYANNDNWFDDVSDGPISATVTIQTAPNVFTDVQALGAWVLVTPPDFAPPIQNVVTMYDLLTDMVVMGKVAIPSNNGLYAPGGPMFRLKQLQAGFSPSSPGQLPGITPDYDTEIKPIISCGYNYYFVDDLVPVKHDSLLDPSLGNPDPAYLSTRQFVLGYMRPPLGVAGIKGKQDMPHILGDDAYNGQAPASNQNLALTHTQYALMWNWSAGQFAAAGSGPPPRLDITPWGLDRAALENCVGGAFFPGIESGWQIRGAGLYLEPFRINPNATSQYFGETGVPIGPGHFSRQMAVPWHADFNDCRNEETNAWWPGQRPNSVYIESTQTRVDWARFDQSNTKTTHMDMLNNWYKYGFVRDDGTGAAFIEVERNSGI